MGNEQVTNNKHSDQKNTKIYSTKDSVWENFEKNTEKRHSTDSICDYNIKRKEAVEYFELLKLLNEKENKLKKTNRSNLSKTLKDNIPSLNILLENMCQNLSRRNNNLNIFNNEIVEIKNDFIFKKEKEESSIINEKSLNDDTILIKYSQNSSQNSRKDSSKDYSNEESFNKLSTNYNSEQTIRQINLLKRNKNPLKIKVDIRTFVKSKSPPQKSNLTSDRINISNYSTNSNNTQPGVAKTLSKKEKN